MVNQNVNRLKQVFVPFLGDFFSIQQSFLQWTNVSRFRPLSRGLFFNHVCLTLGSSPTSFRPLSRGLFFNVIAAVDEKFPTKAGFSSPFSGTFFQSSAEIDEIKKQLVFVPFLGDFFSMVATDYDDLSELVVFVPFLGDFFSICEV